MTKEEKRMLKGIHKKIENHEKLSLMEQRLFDKEVTEFRRFNYPKKTERISKIAIGIAVLSILLSLIRLLFLK